MPVYRSTRAGRTAALAAVVVLGSGCLPSTWVARHAPPPPEIAREEEAKSAATPAATSTPTPPAIPPTAAPRSLADILDLALSRDPTTRAAWFEARAAAAQAGATAATQWLPSIDLTGTLVRQRIGAIPLRPVESTSTTITPSATLSWLLLDAGVRSALVQQADLLAAAARWAEVSAVANLVLAVQQDYFGYLGSLALVEAERATVKQAETSLAAAEARQRAGLATIAAVLQARTALSQARLTLQQYQGQALAVRGALATLAGLPPTAELDVGTLPAEVNTRAAQSAIDARLAEARARNPDLGNARAVAEAAAAQARAAGRAPWPTLNFQATASQPFYYAGGGALDRTSWGGSTASWTVGLQLRIPLLDGLGVTAAYDVLAARASADAAAARADATAQRVALDVWTGYQGVRTAADRIATSRDLLEAARANTDVAQGRYKEGVGSILDLLNAQAALELAQAESIRARADYLVSLAQLARASGRLDASARGAAIAAPQGPPRPAPAPPPAPGGAPPP